MTKTMRNWVVGVVLLLILAIAGLGIWRSRTHQTYVQSSAPTFFFHGGGSNYHAEEHMVSAAKQAGVTQTVIRAMVAKNGRVRLVGRIPHNAVNPIVEVNYANNAELDFNRHGEWAKNVVLAVRREYPFKTMNMVGHSLGNISLIYYALRYSQDRQLPRLVKQVDIAGHFAGLAFKRVPAAIQQPRGLTLDAAGKPNHMNATYRQMTGLRQVLPPNQLAVLNIYGDVGGRTDGTVSNVSSRALKYLVASRAKSYTERKITGKLAQHSRLHRNPQVDRLLIQFLWNR